MATTTPFNSSIISAAGTVPYGDFANKLNQFMTNQAVQPFLANLPGYAGAVNQRSTNTQQMLQGQLPQDVVAQISQQAAERGIGGGGGAAPNSNAAFLRALGLSSLDMMGHGSKELSTSIADTPVPEIWNPASLLVPQQLGAWEEDAAKRGTADAKGAADRARSEQDYRNRLWLNTHGGGWGSMVGRSGW